MLFSPLFEFIYKDMRSFIQFCRLLLQVPLHICGVVVLILSDETEEVVERQVRPQCVYGNHARVGCLPQQKVAEPLLPTRPYEKFRVGWDVQ